MRDIPALAEHLANMVTASDTPRYRSVLADNIRFIERELTTALTEARKQGAEEERERLMKLALGSEEDDYASYDGYVAEWLRSNTGEE